MKLNEVTKPGYYKMVNDTLPDIIFEVIPNTDKEWLKDDPSCTLLVDEWGEGYLDADDRRNYETSGNLVAVKYAYDIEVEPMTEKFIISGNAGSHLTEDKPTYKQMCKDLIKQIKNDLERYEYSGSVDCSDVRCDLRDYLRMLGEEVC